MIKSFVQCSTIVAFSQVTAFTSTLNIDFGRWDVLVLAHLLDTDKQQQTSAETANKNIPLDAQALSIPRLSYA